MFTASSPSHRNECEDFPPLLVLDAGTMRPIAGIARLTAGSVLLELIAGAPGGLLLERSVLSAVWLLEGTVSSSLRCDCDLTSKVPTRVCNLVIAASYSFSIS